MIFELDFFFFFFYQKLESASGNPILKKLVISKLIELKESLNLCDILETLNPKHLLFGNVISPEFCREDLTIYLFQTISKNGLKILKYWMSYQQTISHYFALF